MVILNPHIKCEDCPIVKDLETLLTMIKAFEKHHVGYRELTAMRRELQSNLNTLKRLQAEQ